jgi:hypothetical protein
MTNGWSTVQASISRIFFGGLVGIALLFVANLLIMCFPPSPPYKGDIRWTWFEWEAEVGLPLAFALGALAGLAWRRDRPFRSPLVVVTLSSWNIALLAKGFRSSRTVLPDVPTPPFVTVPNSFVIVFGSLALVLTACLVLGSLARSATSQNQRALCIGFAILGVAALITISIFVSANAMEIFEVFEGWLGPIAFAIDGAFTGMLVLSRLNRTTSPISRPG